jgi:hypothetical protein
MSHYSRGGSSESNAEQFKKVSQSFVETISKLKSNFLVLTKIYGNESGLKEKGKEG